MRVVYAILVCLPLCGCSPRKTSPRSSPQVFTFADGSVMQVQKRDGQSLEDIHVVQKSHDGAQTCDAQKGRLTEDAAGRVVHVVLYDAQVETVLKQRMRVEELRMDFAKEITYK